MAKCTKCEEWRKWKEKVANKPPSQFKRYIDKGNGLVNSKGSIKSLFKDNHEITIGELKYIIIPYGEGWLYSVTDKESNIKMAGGHTSKQFCIDRLNEYYERC